VKNVDAVAVRIAIAAVLASAADAVLVAHHLPKLGVHLVTGEQRQITQLGTTVNVALRKNVAAHHHCFRLTPGL